MNQQRVFMWKYTANFASHRTRDRYFGFFLAWHDRETQQNVLFLFTYFIPQYQIYRVTRILAHTLGGNFKSLCKVNQKLFFSIPHHTKGNQVAGQNCACIGECRVVKTLYMLSPEDSRCLHMLSTVDNRCVILLSTKDSRCLNMLSTEDRCLHMLSEDIRCLHMLSTEDSRCINMLSTEDNRCVILFSIEDSRCLNMLSSEDNSEDNRSICYLMKIADVSICYLLKITDQYAIYWR